jgi:hypothetical protein
VVAAAGRTFLLTPTLRHRMGVKYADLRKALATICRRMKQSWRWRTVVADIRADEVTWGLHGFHLHKHILLTLPHNADAQAFRIWVRDFWEQQARKEGRTCDWPDNAAWWSEVAPESVGLTARYLQKAREVDLMHVAAAEVLGQAAKRGAEPWSLPPAAYVEAWVASKGQRTFALGGLWRTDRTAEVESDEDAADERALVAPAFARTQSSAWRELPKEVKAWLRGSLANAALRSEWVVRLESALGLDLELLEPPGGLGGPVSPPLALR